MEEIRFKIEDITSIKVVSKKEEERDREEVYERFNEEFFSYAVYDDEVRNGLKCEYCGNELNHSGSCEICDRQPCEEEGTLIEENELIELVDFYYNKSDNYTVEINGIILPD